jgi:hypothetical protein
VPLVIAVVAFAIFTALLWTKHIGEASYCFLAAATALLGLVLHGFGRLQELDLKNLRLVLREIEQTKKELFVREEQLKAIAIPLAQILALSGASEGRLGNRETWSLKREWYRKKLQQLIEALQLSSAEAAETRKYTEKYAEIDQLFKEREALQTTDPDYEEVKAKLEALSADLWDMMRTDLVRLS